MICAGFSNSTACNGDSGGPMFICNNEECLQIGVASFVTDQCKPNENGVSVVYSRITKLQEWIEKERLCN